MAGGYRNLLAYRMAVVISDLTDLFIKDYLQDLRFKRTVEQMEQAKRSGKQNIVEGSLEQSMEGNIKLTGVARASFGELDEDFLDFLRLRGLPIWERDDPRVTAIRRIRLPMEGASSSYSTNLSYWSNWMNEPESFANLMLTLIRMECYLLDRLLMAQKGKFVREGGFREKLFRARDEYRRRID